jgi:hypothetical protein
VITMCSAERKVRYNPSEDYTKTCDDVSNEITQESTMMVK